MVSPNELNQFLAYANNRARAEFNFPGSMFRLGSNGQLVLTPQFVGMVGFRTQRDLTKAILKAAQGALGVAAEDLRSFAVGLQNATEHDRGIQKQANEKLAQAMRTGLRAGYLDLVESEKKVPSYRIGQNRFSGGALRRALSSPDMAVATDSGISYLNQDRLNLEARHWARLNYGVAPAPKSPSFKGKLTLFGQTIGTIGSQAQQRPPMFMPRGFWVPRRGSGYNTAFGTGAGVRGAFYPLGRSAVYPTRGIIGRNYIDVGLEALVKEFPTVYAGVFRQWIDEAKAGVRGSRAGTVIRERIDPRH